MDKRRFLIAKFIMLSLSLLSNAFIIFYSCVSSKTTVVWNNFFTNLYTTIANSINKSDKKAIPLESIEASLSSEESYVYNYLPGYGTNQIPLGSAKQIECVFYPDNATDKSITYSVSPSDAATLNQSGSTLSVVGMKTGAATITATSNDGSHTSKVDIEIVETVAPTSYEISLDSYSIAVGTTKTINFDIDGGPLTHDELINFRYYDIRKLAFNSSSLAVAEVDEYGVVYPKSEGNTTITVSNGSYSRSFNIEVTPGTPFPHYAELSIDGSNVCYANDMLLDQSSKKNHYQLTPRDGSASLNPEDFIWESSDELLVKVDKHGVMRGFRKSSLNDEVATITAISKLTGQSATYEVAVKNQLPSKMSIYLIIGGENIWNVEEYTVVAGENISVKFLYDVATQNKNVIATSTDEDVIGITNEGDNVILHTKKPGTCDVTFTSVVNEELTRKVKFTVLKEGSITTDDLESINLNIRKSIGHAAVFMVAQVFTFLALFMFFYDRKWWFYSSISLGEGLFISGLSEFIQYLVPTRKGTFLDVLINFAGVVVGFAITFLVVFLIKYFKNKKSSDK